MYDRIIGIDDHEVSSYTDLSYYLGEYEVGDTITLTVIRNSEEINVSLTLMENTAATDSE